MTQHVSRQYAPDHLCRCMAGGFMTVTMHLQLFYRPLLRVLKAVVISKMAKAASRFREVVCQACTALWFKYCHAILERCEVHIVGTACAFVQSAQCLMTPGQLSPGFWCGFMALMMPTCASWCVCMQVQVDVEGCELQALQGIQDHHWLHIRQVFVSYFHCLLV